MTLIHLAASVVLRLVSPRLHGTIPMRVRMVFVVSYYVRMFFEHVVFDLLSLVWFALPFHNHSVAERERCCDFRPASVARIKPFIESWILPAAIVADLECVLHQNSLRKKSASMAS